MRFAYADPPYVGSAIRRYGAEAREVNHRLLIAHLESDFDGWALSCSSTSLGILLPMCPEKVRVMAWVKSWIAGRENVSPAYAWEPVILRRLPRKAGRMRYPHPFDWTATRTTIGTGTAGAKPEGFAWWLFECSGLGPEDEFVDLFPGSGAMRRAWETWRGQTRAPMELDRGKQLEVPA